jgi:alkanesulfonate monooxygenase SsuD/methylene tetrahydromethanopterin reductase-like flavin-dependent oxidoreductase (luciferase family)
MEDPMTEPLTTGLRSEQPLKLGVFCLNLGGGVSMTKANNGALTWDYNVRVARAADEAGWDFLLPLGRWRGVGGETNPHGKQFEVFTWAAGIGAVTERISVLTTMHVPLLHPLMAAKESATVDHISHGRFGMNIVAGWNGPEFAMFGIDQRPHDQRYDAAEEWLSIMEQLWDENGSADFEGAYYSIHDGYLQPKTIQQPRPLIISAGQSGRGMRFALERADFIFVGGHDIDEVRAATAATEKAKLEYGSSTRILTHSPVVVADTQAEAERYFSWYVDELGDFDAAHAVARGMMAGGNQSIEFSDEKVHELARALVAGMNGMPLVGTPRKVADDLIAMHEAGVSGVGLTWVEYEEGLAGFNEQVLPLLEEAGVRIPDARTA